MAALSRKLDELDNLDEMLDILRSEIEILIGLKHTWIYLLDDEERTVQLFLRSSEQDNPADQYPVFNIQDDPFLQALVNSKGPYIVADARTHPLTNKHLVEKLNNRSLIHIPLFRAGRLWGMLGCGSFGDETVIRPDEKQLKCMEFIGNLVMAVLTRLLTKKPATSLLTSNNSVKTQGDLARESELLDDIT